MRALLGFVDRLAALHRERRADAETAPARERALETSKLSRQFRFGEKTGEDASARSRYVHGDASERLYDGVSRQLI
jgi:hypothetical protein